MHQYFAACIEACAATCHHCAASCLQEHDVRAMARCIAPDLDCADICRLASVCMARGSEAAAAICRLCADICDACGRECGKHAMDNCRECAQACRRCVEACRDMARSAAAMP